MKIITVVGARPQFVKAAMLSRALRAHGKEVMIHTGQHYDENMSGSFFRQLRMPKPDYELNSKAHHHGEQTAQMMIEIERILLQEQPQLVVVYGDTNSTLAGSLVAAKLHIPVAHVEAGLRSFNKRMPEEINRMITDHISTVLFAPTKTAVNQLRNESINKHVYLAGDIMYDAILYYKPQAINQSNILQKYKIRPKQYHLATVHRAENTDQPERLRNIFMGIRKMNEHVIVPLHPRTKKYINRWGIHRLLDSPKITVMDPIPYFDMLALQSQAKTILTDSGGVQKEAYFLRVPCVTLRDETEWIETVEAGWNHIVGVQPNKIINAVKNMRIPDQHPAIFGTGNTAKTITNILVRFLKQHPI